MLSFLLWISLLSRRFFVYHASLPYVKYSCQPELDLQNMTAKAQRIYWQMLLISAIDPLDNSRQCASAALWCGMRFRAYYGYMGYRDIRLKSQVFFVFSIHLKLLTFAFNTQVEHKYKKFYYFFKMLSLTIIYVCFN